MNGHCTAAFLNNKLHMQDWLKSGLSPGKKRAIQSDTPQRQQLRRCVYIMYEARGRGCHVDGSSFSLAHTYTGTLCVARLLTDLGWFIYSLVSRRPGGRFWNLETKVAKASNFPLGLAISDNNSYWCTLAFYFTSGTSEIFQPKSNPTDFASDICRN